jgi:hypothetical protein
MGRKGQRQGVGPSLSKAVEVRELDCVGGMWDPEGDQGKPLKCW